MIHVIIGTKAQLIKMAPIMKELQRREVSYNFIFTGQHQETIGELLDNFNIKEPNIILYKGRDITSIFQMFFWSVKLISLSLFNKKEKLKIKIITAFWLD